MTQPRFLADEDLQGSIVKSLRRHYPEVNLATVHQEGLSGASDEEILAYAWVNLWLVVSHDVTTMSDAAFRRIADGRGVRGLFLVPQDRPVQRIVEEIHLIASASDLEEWRDGVFYLPLR